MKQRRYLIPSILTQMSKEFLMSLDWSPLWISLKTGIVATIVCFFLGIFAARKNIEGQRTLSKYCGWHIDTANGFAADGRRFLSIAYFFKTSSVRHFLWDAFHLKVVQSWLGCIIAASVISFPLMYKNARAAFELIDENLVYAGRTLGMSDFSIFGKSSCLRQALV